MRNLTFTLAVIAALVYLGILRSPGWENWFFEQVSSRLEHNDESGASQWRQALDQLSAKVTALTDRLDQSSLQVQVEQLQQRLDHLEASALQVDGAAFGHKADIADEVHQTTPVQRPFASSDSEPQSSALAADSGQQYMSPQVRRRELLNLAEGLELRSLATE